jgi:membrane protein DedA with SNARE-associated domain
MDWLTDLVSASAWTYAVIALAVALDAVLPLVPGEAVVITSAVLAADGRLSAILIAVAATAGSFVGDNASFGIGRGLGGPVVRRLRGRERSGRLTAWAEEQLRRRGTLVIIGARFVPGGRTATTLAAGGLAMAWRRFAAADLIAASVWATYTTALGYIGGETFNDRPWLAVGCSLAIALLIGGAGELTRRALTARQGGEPRTPGPSADPPASAARSRRDPTYRTAGRR